MSKWIVQIVVGATKIVGRAFARAVQQEINASKEAAKRAGGGASGRKKVATDAVTGMTLEEAQQVLNVKDISDQQLLEKNYKHLFDVNEKSKGGSLYLQSKVFRAKERIDLETQGSAQQPSASDQTDSKTESTQTQNDSR